MPDGRKSALPEHVEYDPDGVLHEVGSYFRRASAASFDLARSPRHITRVSSPSPVAPQVFDRALVRQLLARACRAGAADFLLARAAEDLDERLQVVTRRFEDILDIGTPTPIVAKLLAARGPKNLTRVAPIDAAVGEGAWTGIVGDEEALPFPPESFDLVTSALALQYVNDLPGALSQIRRALKPDGLFLGCLVGGRSLHELRAAMTQAESEVRGGASPRVAPFADVRDMGGLLQRAGFALPVTDVDTLTLRYDHLFALVRDLRAMGATNALATRDRRPLTREIAARAAAIYADQFADPDGRIRATIEIIWLTGWAPHESQQQPLKPGSARSRLADALGAKETKLTP
jgi:SAM-dependent methyltransferase